MSFERPVSSYMSRAVESAAPETSVEAIASMMHRAGVSGIPVVEDGAPVGVVTRSDLIALGAFQTGRRWTSPAMPLPPRRARDVMTRDPRTVAETATVRDAAKLMTDHAIHRLFVVDGAARLTGVFSTRDVTAAVRDARVEAPISAVMTSPLITLDVRAPLAAAIDLLARVQITGVVATEDGRPVGVFTQLDALASRDVPRSTPIEALFDAGVICLPEDTRLHRAAGHAAQLDVRRVIACRHHEAVGIVSGLDFARVASGWLS